MNILKGLCCWGTDYCKCQAIGLSRNQNIKLTYIIMLILGISLSYLITTIRVPSQATIQLYECDSISYTIQKKQTCVKQQITFRVLFAFSTMHFLLAIIIAFRNQLSKILNEGFWVGKIIYLCLISFIVIFVAPNGLVQWVQGFTIYLSPLWYLLQNFILIDFIYSIDNGLKQCGQKNQKILILKALFSFLFTIGSVVLNVLSYITPNNQQTVYISVVSSVIIVFFLILTLFRVVKGHTLFTYGFVMLYINIIAYYLRFPSGSYSSSSFQIIQLALILLSLLFILSPGSNKIRTKKSSLNEILALNTSKQEQDNRYVSSNKWIIFHLIFYLICLALTWVIYQSGYGRNSSKTQQERISQYHLYRVIGWFLIITVYIWSLITAKIYPEQDFDQLQNYFKQFELN